MTNDITRPKSVQMPQRWPARVHSVIATGPESIALLYRVEDQSWNGRPLRQDYTRGDAQFARLREAAGCGPESDGALEGYPVWVWTTPSSGYYHVVDVAPAPAGRSPNGLKWVRLDQMQWPREQGERHANGS
ncbi:MAG: hypothetical protein KIT58_11645 [Planctomycetota bacterium]|nr:hypothetical protein [Planctomycetota bacterium]